jgi:hypothetical protein
MVAVKADLPESGKVAVKAVYIFPLTHRAKIVLRAVR